MTLMRSMRFISFQDEFADLPHAWNIATGELVVDVLQVLLQLGQAFALGTIVRVVLEPSDPHVVFFVVGEFRFHTFLRICSPTNFSFDGSTEGPCPAMLTHPSD